MAVKKTTSEASLIAEERRGAEEPGQNTNGMKAELQALAYQLWLDRGSPAGSPEIDWFEAEARIQQQLRARGSGRRPEAYRTAAGLTGKP